MTMNDLMHTWPGCGGAMRRSQYSHICAQEHGPCGILHWRKSSRGAAGGSTKFSHTSFNRKSNKLHTVPAKNFPFRKFWRRGKEISEQGYMERAGRGPRKKARPGMRAVLVQEIYA